MAKVALIWREHQRRITYGMFKVQQGWYSGLKKLSHHYYKNNEKKLGGARTWLGLNQQPFG